MVSLSLKDLIRRVRSLSDIEDSLHVTDQDITDSLQKSFESLYQTLVLINNSYFVVKRPFTIREKENYIPYDLYKLKRIDKYYGGRFTTLRRKEFLAEDRSDNLAYGDFLTGSGEYSYQYVFTGNKLHVYPNSDLDTNGNFVIYYIPKPPLISSGLARMHAGWDQWIVYDACVKSKIKSESGITEIQLKADQLMMHIKKSADDRDASPKSMDIVEDYGLSSLGYLSRSKRFSYPIPSVTDIENSYEDLLIPYFNETNEYGFDFLEFYVPKSAYYEYVDKVAYIGFQHKDNESEWCICKIENRKITYGIYSINTAYPDLSSAWLERLNLRYQASLEIAVPDESGVVSSVESPHILLGWSQSNLSDPNAVNSSTFTRLDSPYPNTIPFPASALREAYFIIGLSNEARLTSFVLGGLDQIGAFSELGVKSSYRYYISDNALFADSLSGDLFQLGISGQAVAIGSVVPSNEGSLPSLGNVSLKLLWSNTDGYPDIQGDSRVLAYNSDSASKTISGEFHNANDGLKVFRGDNNFWLKDEEIASNGDISSVLSEYDDSAMRTTRPALSLAGKLVDLDVSPSNELFLLQEAVGTKTERYSRYTIPESGLPTLASETNDANSGTLSRVVGGDDDVLVCREEVVASGITYIIDNSNNSLYSLNETTGVKTLIGEEGALGDGDWESLTWNGTNLITINNANKSFYIVNRSTGVTTLLGAIVFSGSGTPNWYSLTWNGTDYFSINDNDKKLYRINKDTRVATLYLTLPDGFWYSLTWNGTYFYAIDSQHNSLYVIYGPLAVPTYELIGSSGSLGVASWNSLAWNGTNLKTINNTNNSLYTLSRTNATTTLIGNEGSLGNGNWYSMAYVPVQIHGNLARFYAYKQSDNTRQSSLDFDFAKNTGESVEDLFYTGSYLNIVLSDGTNSRTVVYKREASSYVRQSSLDKAFTGVNFDNASFDNKKLFNVSSIADDMSGGGSGGTGMTLLYGIRNDSVERRLYSIDPATGVATALSYINPTADDPTGTGDWTNLASLNQTLYSINYDNDSLYSIDPATGVATLIGSTGTARFRWEALAFIGSTLYGIADYDDKLYTINTSTGVATLVGEMNSGSSRSYRSLASVGGNLYAPNSFNGSFYSINTSTGVATELGILVDSNGSVVRIQGLTSIGTTLYGVSNDNKLYSIDPSTRIATEISSTPDDIRCLTAVTTQGGA